MRRLIALLLFLGSAALHADRLRVVTWNLGFNPQDSAWSADGERVARIASLLRTLNADVILLQAVPDRQTCETLAGLLAPAHYQVATCSAFTDAAGQNLSQVVILSKPSVAAAWIEPWKPEGSIAPAGGLVGAAIRLGTDLVVVYSVALKNNLTGTDSERDSQFNILERELCAAQLAQQTRSLDGRLTNHAAGIIIAGSLNTNPDEPRFVSELTLRLLEAAGFKNGFNGAPLRERITYSAGGNDTEATFDYVFARGAHFPGGPAVVPSDLAGHFPVMCDLVVPPAGPISRMPPTTRLPILWRWWAPVLATLPFLFLLWRFGRRKRFNSPAPLSGRGIEELLSSRDHALEMEAFGASGLDNANDLPIQDAETDLTRSRIGSLERRAIAAERRAARATEIVRQGLVPYLARILRDTLFRGVVSQRTRLLEVQEAGARQVAELERRMARIQIQLQNRLTAYERRIAELEKEVSAKDKANCELLAARSRMMKQAQQAAYVREGETQVGSNGPAE
jgi:endonuclease/exonuclease/phosphatase (EEP) superfamily protein YafD